MTALISVAILSGLNKLERSDLLKKYSSIKNLSLIVAPYLYFGKLAADHLRDGKSMLGLKTWNIWPFRIIGYATHKDLDLANCSYPEIEELLERFERKNGKGCYNTFPKTGGSSRMHTRGSSRAII